MASVGTYLNFAGNTEEASAFYKEVFGTAYIGDIVSIGDMPAEPGQPESTDAEKRLIANIQLPILGGHILQGTGTIESMGQPLNLGNAHYICLNPDTREEAEARFAALSTGGTVGEPLSDQLWGHGTLVDKFGIYWMINESPANALYRNHSFGACGPFAHRAGNGARAPHLGNPSPFAL